MTETAREKSATIWWYSQKRKTIGQIERELETMRMLRRALADEI